MTYRTEFTMDTSGVVIVPLSLMTSGDAGLNGSHHHTFAGLSPFEQGYVAKLLEEASERIFDQLCSAVGTAAEYVSYGFSDLAPETLAAIRKDCAAHEKTYPLMAHDPRRRNRGLNFWRNRQAGMWTNSGWPPLSVTLGDDGKVYARAAS